jgi:hypothetical protein
MSTRELWKWRSGGKRGKPKPGFPPFPPFPPLPGNLAENARFPHFHSSGGGLYIQFKRQRTRTLTGGRGKVEIQKADSHFTTASRACGARKNAVRKAKKSADFKRQLKGHFYRGNNGDISNEA